MELFVTHNLILITFLLQTPISLFFLFFALHIQKRKKKENMVVLLYFFDSQFIFSFGDHEVNHNVDFSGFNIIMETIYPYKKDNKHNTLWHK